MPKIIRLLSSHMIQQPPFNATGPVSSSSVNHRQYNVDFTWATFARQQQFLLNLNCQCSYSRPLSGRTSTRVLDLWPRWRQRLSRCRGNHPHSNQSSLVKPKFCRLQLATAGSEQGTRELRRPPHIGQKYLFERNNTKCFRKIVIPANN